MRRAVCFCTGGRAPDDEHPSLLHRNLGFTDADSVEKHTAACHTPPATFLWSREASGDSGKVPDDQMSYRNYLLLAARELEYVG